jgi:hypothetical protein
MKRIDLSNQPRKTKRDPAETILKAFGALAVIIPVTFLLVTVAWATAWLVTHFPGLS